MDWIDFLASDKVLFGLFGLAAVAFIWNGERRIAWEEAWKEREIRIPERMLLYGAKELEAFVEATRGVRIRRQPALGFYADSILRRCDIAYAIALALVTAYVWFRLWIAYEPTASESWLSSAIVWFAPYFGGMAIAYGVADVCEDLKLAAILWPKAHPGDHGDRYPEIIDRADAAAVNMLTVIKMLTLLLSVIGFILFLLLRLLQSIAKDLTGLGSASIEAVLNVVRTIFGSRVPAPGATAEN